MPFARPLIVLLIFSIGWLALPLRGAEDSAELAEARRTADAYRRAQAEAREKGARDLDLLEKADNAALALEDAYTKAIEKDPEHPRARLEFGRYWLERREFARAREHLEAAYASPRAQEKENPVFNRNETEELLLTLGALNERAGDTLRAIRFYEKAVAAETPKDGAPPASRGAIALAVAHCAAGQPVEARRALEPFLPWVAETQQSSPPPPYSGLAIYTLAIALEESGRLDEALKTYHAAERLERALNKGDALGIIEKSNLAIARLDDLFDGYKAREEARLRENEARVKENERRVKAGENRPPLQPVAPEAFDYRTAAELYEKAVDKKKKALAAASPEFLQRLARARSGEATEASLDESPEFAQLREVLTTLQEALVKYPRHAGAHFELGATHRLAGRYAAARTHLDAAAVHSPNSVAYLQWKADVLLSLGQWKDASDALKRLLTVEPESGRANFSLAVAAASLQADLPSCQSGLDALEKAVQLGVRDRRLLRSDLLVLKDGTELEGTVAEYPEGYVIQKDGKPLKVARADVAERTLRPGLRQQLQEAIGRFERGEARAPQRITRRTVRPEEGGGIDPGFGTQGTIFGQ